MQMKMQASFPNEKRSPQNRTLNANVKRLEDELRMVLLVTDVLARDMLNAS